MAFRQCFLKTTWTDQNSSTKVLQNIIAPNCTIWPSELNKKVLPVFPRNIPYRARPKGPPFIFFGTARLFFEKKIPRRVPPAFFWCFATEWMLKNPKGSPFQFFRHCETLASQGLALAGPGEPLGPFFEYVIFRNFFFKKNRISSTVKKNTWHLEVFLLFLSLGYGADLGRSRLFWSGILLNKTHTTSDTTSKVRI